MSHEQNASFRAGESKAKQNEDIVLEDEAQKNKDTDNLILTDVLMKAPIDYKAVFDLLHATLGLGLLSMADIVRGYGVILSFFILFVFAGYNFLSGILLLNVRKMTGKSTYEECADACFGKPGRIILRVLIIVTCLGLSVMYLVMTGYMLSRLVRDVRYVGAAQAQFQHSREFWVIMSTIIVIPFTLRRKIQANKFLNFLGLLCKGLILCILLYMLAAGASRKKVDIQMFPSTTSQTTFSVNDFLSYTVAMILPFTFQPIFLEFFQEKGYGKNQKLEKVLLISQIATFLSYYFFGLIGYLAFGSGVSHDILIEFNRDNAGAGLYTFTYGLAVLALLFTYPVWFFPLKKQLYYLYLSVDFFLTSKFASPELKLYLEKNYRPMKLRYTNDKLKSLSFQFFILVLNFAVAAIAVLSSNSFLYVFDLVCMIFFPFINYGFPAVLFLKLRWGKRDRYFWMIMVYLLIVVLFSCLSAGAILFTVIVWY